MGYVVAAPDVVVLVLSGNCEGIGAHRRRHLGQGAYPPLRPRPDSFAGMALGPLSRSGVPMSSKGPTEMCRHTITLISTSGGVYQLICEEKGAHDEHSVAVYRRDPDAIRMILAAQRESRSTAAPKAGPARQEAGANQANHTPSTRRLDSDMAPTHPAEAGREHSYLKPSLGGGRRTRSAGGY